MKTLLTRNEPRLTIVIINYNTFSFLIKCVRSIYAGNFPLSDLEIIIVDNASSEKKIENIKTYFPHIKLIKNNKNIGFAAANNLALKNITSEYSLLLNPDTIVLKDAIAELIKFMDENKMASAVTCKVELDRGVLDDACHRGFPTPWRAFCYFTGLSYLFPKSILFNGYHLGFRNMTKVHEIDSCVGAFMMVRTSAGKQIGWLDEDYFWYGEDLDFCYRLKLRGGKIFYYPDVKIIHYKGISSGIKSHSYLLSTANKQTQLTATLSRYEVMRLFYLKHFQTKYPNWLKNIIMLGVRLKEYISLLRLKN